MTASNLSRGTTPVLEIIRACYLSDVAFYPSKYAKMNARGSYHPNPASISLVDCIALLVPNCAAWFAGKTPTEWGENGGSGCEVGLGPRLRFGLGPARGETDKGGGM